jgi:proteasome accessory factor B
MAGEERMEPLERLLNLVGLLLEARIPLTFDEIRDTLEAYRADNPDTAKRMFERDKDILREYGVPLELVDTDAWGVEQGYVIDKEKYYLPEIAFTSEEMAALFVAAQGGGEDTTAEQGIRKLLYGADGGILVGLAGGPLASGSDARSSLVLAAADAAQTRRHVRFGYRTSEGKTGERDVDAYAMVFRGGHWYLLGRDHARDDVRAFRLSRFTGELSIEGDGHEPPDGFRAADHVQGGPWAPTGDDRAVVAFEPDAAWLAQHSLAGAERLREREDGRIELAVPFADAAVAASLLLQFGPEAEVLEPAALRQEVMSRLEAFVRV